MIEPIELINEGFRPLKRVEYDQLVEMGAFQDEKIELLYGRLVPMSPQKSPHAGMTHWISKVLSRALGDRAEVRGQFPLALSETSEPEPDIAVVPPGRYLDAHPREAWLVVEVAESSTRKDRQVKSVLYAEGGVVEYWLVDLKADVVEVFRDPVGGTYRSVQAMRRGGQVTLVHFPDVTLPVDQLLPPAQPHNGSNGHG